MTELDFFFLDTDPQTCWPKTLEMSRNFVFYLEHVVGAVVAVPELGAGAVVPEAELDPGAHGEGAQAEPEGELVGEAVAGAGHIHGRQVVEGAPVVDGPADGNGLVVVDVEDADNAGNQGGRLHVGVLQAHLLAHHRVEEAGGAARLVEHGHQGGQRHRSGLTSFKKDEEILSEENVLDTYQTSKYIEF